MARISLYLGIMILVTLSATLLIIWLGHLPICRRWLGHFTIKSFTDFARAPQLARRLWKENWPLLLVIICGFIVTVVQLVVAHLPLRPFSWTLLTDIFTNSTNQIILTVIIFSSAFLLLFSLINRFWPALVFTIGLSIVISVAVFLKLDLRDEPLLPADLAMITALNELLKMVSPFMLVAAGSLLLALVVISVVLQLKLGGVYAPRLWQKRLLMLGATMTFFAGSFWVNHDQSLPNQVFKAFNVNPLFYDQAGGARLNGPLIQFINNLDVTIMARPAGYSQARIKKVMARYDQVAKQLNQTRTTTSDGQTMIFALSESFSDPARVPQMQVTPNPIPFVTSLKQTTDSGLMLSCGYGGGTANIEWQALTGLSISNLSPTLPTPYTQLVSKQKIVPAFTNLFDSKIAIHPYNASLYNRKQVFKAFGFQQFYYQGSNDQLSYEQKLADSSYISDASAYKQTMKVIKRTQSGSRFIQLSTMQNHMPYTTNYKGKKFRIMGSAFDETNRDSVETYVQGLSYTDKALKQFIAEIDKVDKPVTVVWYGDHLAGLYKSSLMDKYPIQLHQTDYFI
ncbi:sulfatase-like hydrolase/transferase, partial [Loigolactobacillus coryniformis]|nr:sulfatase-like hydrolase/transferase [Loigolactobacillus coryniformis]